MKHRRYILFVKDPDAPEDYWWRRAEADNLEDLKEPYLERLGQTMVVVERVRAYVNVAFSQEEPQ